jgi:hypothetical protein
MESKRQDILRNILMIVFLGNCERIYANRLLCFCAVPKPWKHDPRINYILSQFASVLLLC